MNTYYSPTNLNNSDEYYRQVLYYQGLAKQERREIRRMSNMLGLAVILSELIQVAMVFTVMADSRLAGLFDTSSVFQDSILILCVEFLGLALPFGLIALINRKRYKVSIIPNDKIGFAKGFRWVCFGMLGCVAADYITEGVIVIFDKIGYSLDYPETPEPTSIFACVLTIVSTAVVPALCEEFAMRCCSLGLMRNYGKAFGVVTVSIIFGLLHGNVIQFVFAGLVGLILGYITVKTGSVWPAVFVHGFNNAISAFGSVASYINGEEIGDWFYIIFFVFWIVSGIVCSAWIFLKGEFKNDESKPEPLPFANTFGSKLGAFMSSPLLLIAMAFLVFAVITSIAQK